jgi:cyanophycin synthetase
MIRLLTNSLTFRGLYAAAMLKAFLRFRNPRRRAAGRHQDAFYEQAWRDAAAALGGTYTPLGGSVAEVAVDDFRTRVMDNTCEIDGPVTLAVLADKPLTYRVLAAEGIPVPRHETFTAGGIERAARFLADAGGHCVVKPASGTGGGRGVTTGVRTRLHLWRAAAAAAVYGDELLIEEQIAGDNYRLLYLDGRLIDAFVRRLPTVTGDGRSTVRRLLRGANDDRLRQGFGASQVLLTDDLDMRRTLARQGLSFASVPEAGRVVTLKTVVNENRGSDNSAALGLCPALVEQGARAARALGVRLAGVDVITTDPAVPLAAAGGVMLEVNAPPNFYYHYHKSGGRFPVALHLLRQLMADRCERGPVGPAASEPDLAVAGGVPR